MHLTVLYHYHCEGHYIILVAYMSVGSLPAHPVLPPDYVQPAVSVDAGIICKFRTTLRSIFLCGFCMVLNLKYTFCGYNKL